MTRFLEYIKEQEVDGSPSRIKTPFKVNNISFVPGNIYVFQYKNYVTPNYVPDRIIGSPVTYLHMYAFNEVNRKTGHQWKVIEGICLDYVEQAYLRNFLKSWYNMNKLNNGKSAYYTWEQAKNTPMHEGIRRYVYDPPRAHIYNISKVDFPDIPQFMKNYTSAPKGYNNQSKVVQNNLPNNQGNKPNV